MYINHSSAYIKSQQDKSLLMHKSNLLNFTLLHASYFYYISACKFEPHRTLKLLTVGPSQIMNAVYSYQIAAMSTCHVIGHCPISCSKKEKLAISLKRAIPEVWLFMYVRHCYNLSHGFLLTHIIGER